MSDVRDDQDVAESVDPDVLPDYDDPAGNLMYPPDVPMGVQEYGTTAAEERVDEPLEERVAREVPDTLDAVEGPAEETIARIEAEHIEKSSTDTGDASAVRIPTRERSLLASLPRLVRYGSDRLNERRRVHRFVAHRPARPSRSTWR